MQQQWQLICKHLRLKRFLFDWRAISQIDVVSNKIQLQLDLRVAQPWNMWTRAPVDIKLENSVPDARKSGSIATGTDVFSVPDCKGGHGSLKQHHHVLAAKCTTPTVSLPKLRPTHLHCKRQSSHGSFQFAKMEACHVM
jgi:hypothetical protein